MRQNFQSNGWFVAQEIVMEGKFSMNSNLKIEVSVIKNSASSYKGVVFSERGENHCCKDVVQLTTSSICYGGRVIAEDKKKEGVLLLVAESPGDSYLNIVRYRWWFLLLSHKLSNLKGNWILVAGKILLIRIAQPPKYGRTQYFMEILKLDTRREKQDLAFVSINSKAETLSWRRRFLIKQVFHLTTQTFPVVRIMEATSDFRDIRWRS